MPIRSRATLLSAMTLAGAVALGPAGEARADGMFAQLDVAPGDVTAVLIADLDYDSMQAACAALARRCGADLIRIALPEPATHQALIDSYAAALDAHPNVRMMLLTHISHRTGLMLPVREIVAMARQRGVDAIVDAAHSWCQADFTLPDLQGNLYSLADFRGKKVVLACWASW